MDQVINISIIQKIYLDHTIKYNINLAIYSRNVKYLSGKNFDNMIKDDKTKLTKVIHMFSSEKHF